MGNINWTEIFSYVGIAYVALTAAAGFCASLSSGFKDFWPGGSAFFAKVAQVCGTIAGALHTLPVSKLAGPAKKAAPLACLAISILPGCLAGSFEEARLAGVRQDAVSASVTRGAGPSEAKSAGDAAVRSSAPSEYCAALDGKQMVLHALAAGAGALSASSGIPALILDSDAADVKRGLAAGAVIAATAGAVLVLWADGASSSWVRDCSDKAVSR